MKSAQPEKEHSCTDFLCDIEATLDIQFHGDTESPATVECMTWKHVNIVPRPSPNDSPNNTTKSCLDMIAYSQNKLTIESNGHTQTFQRETSFTAQDVLDCLLILEKMVKM